MANKKESDTLRQRKFAQQEFLKLKKMQKGELDAGPKPSEIYAKPLTFSEKIKNIWYHDKWIITTVAIITICIALFVTQCSTRKKYDAIVVVFTYELIDDRDCEKFGEYLKPFCIDLNNDGEVNISVINCSIDQSQGNTQYNYSNRTKVSTTIASEASALLFITDDDSYQHLSSLSKDIDLFEGEPIKFEQDFYEFCKNSSEYFILPENLQISCRTIEGTTISKDKNIDIYYKQAQAIINALKQKYAK